MAYTEIALYVDSVAYAGVAQWAATTAYTVGQIRRQLAAPAAGSERCFVCVVAGTSGGSEPNWVINASFKGNKVTDNTVTWQECTAHPSLNGDSTNVAVWRTAAGTIAIGTIIKNTAGTHFFITTTSGSGTTTEPTWNTTTGATTNDGSNTWTCLGAISSFTARWAAPAARLQHLLNTNTSWLANANMVIYVGDDHAESSSSASTVNYNPGNQCSILCVDHTVALPAGASDLRTTGGITHTANGAINFALNNSYVYGLQLISTGTVNVIFISGTSSNTRVRMEQCTLSFSGATPPVTARFYLGDGGTGSVVELKDCTFHAATAGQSIAPAGQIKIENPTFTGSWANAATLVMFSGANVFAQMTVEGADFTAGASGSLIGLTSGGVNQFMGYALFKDCLLPAGMNLFRNGAGVGLTDAGIPVDTTIDLVRCDSGGTNYRNERHTTDGTETTLTAIVRTGGASDGTTPVGHQIVPTANATAFLRPFHAITLAALNTVTGTNRNVTCYGIANDSRVPNNDEIWFDVEYLGSASSPKGSFARGGKQPLATAAALTADTSAWDSAATARANSTAYVVGDVRKVASNPGRVFFCTTAGTSAGSEPGGYASAVDGGSVTDGSAVFRAGCRFKQTLVLSSPQPAQAGYIYAYPKSGRASTTYIIDPAITIS